MLWDRAAGQSIGTWVVERRIDDLLAGSNPQMDPLRRRTTELVDDAMCRLGR